MPDLDNAATTCPLCLGPDEVLSMVVVEIDRTVPRGRVAIMICRSCAGAVIRAARNTEPELSDMTAWLDQMKVKSNAEGDSTKPNGEKASQPFEKRTPVGNSRLRNRAGKIDDSSTN